MSRPAPLRPARRSALLPGGPDSIVPPAGFTMWLTFFTSAAMAFLAVFALAFSLAAGRLAERWESALARSATVRISAPADQLELQARAALRVLRETPGVRAARLLSLEEERALLAPWFGPDLPLDTLPMPRLIDVTEGDPGYDAEGLRLRLKAEAPGAVLDDHTRWRRPLVQAAGSLRLLGLLSALLIAGAMAAMITLAANAALSANIRVIRVLRLIGARDSYIARAFMRRFTLRAFLGAASGAAIGLGLILLLPGAAEGGGFLTGLGFRGAAWLWPVAVPVLAALVALGATWAAARRALGRMP